MRDLLDDDLGGGGVQLGEAVKMLINIDLGIPDRQRVRPGTIEGLQGQRNGACKLDKRSSGFCTVAGLGYRGATGIDGNPLSLAGKFGGESGVQLVNGGLRMERGDPENCSFPTPGPWGLLFCDRGWKCRGWLFAGGGFSDRRSIFSIPPEDPTGWGFAHI